MEDRAEFRIRIPIEFTEEVRLRKEGKRLEATDRELRGAFARVILEKGGELLGTGELYVKDAHALVLEEAEAGRQGGELPEGSTVKISIPVPPTVFEKAGKIKEEYTGGQLSARKKDILDAVTSVLRGLASELLIEGKAEIKDLYLLLLEKIE